MMKKMGLNEIRKSFLDFFESKGHYVGKSYSLVPEKDKSLLLINAGMAPLKDFFMGNEVPPNNRMATCQKCIRTGDIENVGITSRHATFFEMLGNFSFGDYFKTETITWGWEFVTEVLKMPLDKLWVTVYLDDDEAYDIWAKEIGVSEDRIVRLGKEDNFWEIGQGPCGPCSEIYYDRGEKYGCDNPDCKPGCECDRFVEFWNHVFTQFNKDEKGNYNPLENPNIDTGMGLERVACLMQNVESIFEIDTIKYILDHVCELTGKTYGDNDKETISLRIITDHIRAVSFMVGDGILPNNEGRGYVLRRLLRRAARHGKLMGVKDGFLYKLVDSVIKVSGEAYPVLVEKESYIKKVIKNEEDRFQQTIDQGLDILNNYLEVLKAKGKNEVSGEMAFKLYDTYGFPIDLTSEIAEEKGFSIDMDKFEKEMESQRERARNARGNGDELGWEDSVLSSIDSSKTSKFVGYTDLDSTVKIMNIVVNHELAEEAVAGEEVVLILDKTPFYAESGGQTGDRGTLASKGAKVEITNTTKGNNGLFLHHGKVVEGTVEVSSEYQASVYNDIRMDIARNHTATHLLHKALKLVVGDHVNQAGSLVEKDRLRFDFTHFEGLTSEEILKVESIVNDSVFRSLSVDVEEMKIEDAKKKGATALFGEKYSDNVRVVTVGDFSIELCGGTHLANTSQVGMFKIVSEAGVASGVRRIEAITGRYVYDYMLENDKKINNVATLLKTKKSDIEKRIQVLNDDLRNLGKELDAIKREQASGELDSLLDNIKKIGKFNLVSGKFQGMDMNTLREMGDKLKDKVEDSVVVLSCYDDSKVNFIVMASENAVKNGAHSGNLIREVAKVAGGGGGGRPNMAQAGGKDPNKVDDALLKAEEILLQI
jgi:alanyl-tRNA synthetase